MASFVDDVGPFVDSKVFYHGGVLANGRSCGAIKNHTPLPIFLHRVTLTPWGEESLADILLCGNCSEAMAVYQLLQGKFDGYVPGNIQAHFAVGLRKISANGWNLYKSSITS